MKRTALLLIALIAGISLAHAQPEARLEWSKGNAYRSDTVRTTSVKVATKNFGGLRKISVVNLGKVGGGSGWLWVGQIFAGGRSDTSTTRDASGWYGACRLYPFADSTIPMITFDPTLCDTIWMKSSDSVKVDIYQW